LATRRTPPAFALVAVFALVAAGVVAAGVVAGAAVFALVAAGVVAAGVVAGTVAVIIHLILVVAH